MLEFMGVCGFESSVKNEKAKHDAYVCEYKNFVISVRCIQSTENVQGGFVSWIWKKEGNKLDGYRKMKGIAHCASDLPIIVSETKKFIDTL